MVVTSKLVLMIVTVTAVIVSAPAAALAQGGAVPINNGTFAKFVKASSNFASYMKQHPADSSLDDGSYDNEPMRH